MEHNLTVKTHEKAYHIKYLYTDSLLYFNDSIKRKIIFRKTENGELVVYVKSNKTKTNKSKDVNGMYSYLLTKEQLYIFNRWLAGEENDNKYDDKESKR